MNADRLITLYGRIADAPDAIPRLRGFVLDLAVRGKVVPQDPADEPASELLKRIVGERAGLVKSGEAAKPNTAEPIGPHEFPFDLPFNWQWVRLASILTKLTDGTHHSPPNGPDGDVLYITAKNIKNDGVNLDDVTYIARNVHEEIFARCNPELGDVLYIKDGATTGVVTVNDLEQPFSMLSSIALLKLPACLFNRLVVAFLRSPYFYDQMRGFMKGAAITRVTLKRMGPALLPLPPLAEQYRIVAKVDELMALCDQLEAARAEREATRDRLVTASLKRLVDPADADDPDRQRASARFVFDNLPALTTDLKHVQQLRQTILGLAVRGRLVKQDPADEPASQLIKRIGAQLAKGERSARGRNSKPLPEVDLADAPYELAEGWVWARFPELGEFGRGKSRHRPRNDPMLYVDGTHPMVQTGDVARSRGRITTFTSKYNDLGLAQSMLWPQGTLCITIAANIADSGILGFDACFPDSVVGFLPAADFDNARYFEYFVRTAKANLSEFAPATAQKNINLEILTSLLIPLPPLAEQRRIVARVDELMALCDQLEASLSTSDETRHRLLDAVLREALQSDLTALAAAQ